jgi:serine/threonine protein kinase
MGYLHPLSSVLRSPRAVQRQRAPLRAHGWRARPARSQLARGPGALPAWLARACCAPPTATPPARRAAGREASGIVMESRCDRVKLLASHSALSTPPLRDEVPGDARKQCEPAPVVLVNSDQPQMAAASILAPPGNRNAAAASRLIGRTLRDTYRILDLLDEGGMGIVFLAEHVRLHRRVAVKLLAGHLANQEQALARFQREAEVISQLQHPHIVSVLDFDRTDAGEPYLVMELLQGESLEERLARERLLPADEAVAVACQVADGLGAAHRASIVHRDLKPANVFLVYMDEEGAFVKLLDFGISKVASRSTHLTGEHEIVGTPNYMSPEQASGGTALVDHRGDQYSLAVITFEMLTGQLPFTGKTVPHLLQRVLSDPPPSLASTAPHLPQSLDPVLQRALSKQPAERYTHIGEFAAELARAIDQGAWRQPRYARTVR